MSLHPAPVPTSNPWSNAAQKLSVGKEKQKQGGTRQIILTDKNSETSSNENGNDQGNGRAKGRMKRNGRNGKTSERVDGESHHPSEIKLKIKERRRNVKESRKVEDERENKKEAESVEESESGASSEDLSLKMQELHIEEADAEPELEPQPKPQPQFQPQPLFRRDSNSGRRPMKPRGRYASFNGGNTNGYNGRPMYYNNNNNNNQGPYAGAYMQFAYPYTPYMPAPPVPSSPQSPYGEENVMNLPTTNMMMMTMRRFLCLFMDMEDTPDMGLHIHRCHHRCRQWHHQQ